MRSYRSDVGLKGAPADEDEILDVEGWKIRSSLFGLLVFRFGKKWAHDYCKNLAQQEKNVEQRSQRAKSLYVYVHYQYRPY